MPFDPSILQPNPPARRSILPVLKAALAAVDPAAAVQAVCRREGNTLYIGEDIYALDAYRRIYVIGAGKAGVPMTQAVESLLGDRLTGGLVVVKTGHAADGSPAADGFSATAPAVVEVVEAAHPRPDAAGVAAGERILEIAADAQADDLVIALLSGGGSALLVSPADGLTLDDLQQLTDALLACGATINEVNCLRKHCSRVKGGQLARAAAPAALVTLALSDVVGSPLDVIASGPTVPDATTWADAWAIVEKYDLQAQLPQAVLDRLAAGFAGEIEDTPKPGDPLFAGSRTLVVADNRVAALAARAAAENAGYHTQVLTTFLQGEAAQIANVAVALAQEIRHYQSPVAPPACLILGGETTVTLGSDPGRGGRNQELALAAALALADSEGINVVSLATDGTDGPTDSAGGWADGGTVARGHEQGLDAAAHLRRHDAYPFLQATHDLLRTGPTQTNVNDLLFIFVEP